LLTAYFSLEHTWNIPHDESYAGKMWSLNNFKKIEVL
jgi:hypothetical protein